ncbi:hypothetical protein V865_005016 [Kwoniella europaea PYCC6329]|uniref:MAGE domain-containing protein n=1 Tax=Kwoniella europaea PYCC6329 TaxID=1423913 RepID=A0AAX4KLA6_9TREE
MAPKLPNTYASQGPSQRRRPQAALSDSDSDEDGDYQANGNGRTNGNANRDDEEEEDQGQGSTQAGAGGLKDSEIRIRSSQLARYALFQEYKRNLIRRADIVKNVLPNNPRAYNLVFDGAQKILRESVGCELVEVRGRGKGAIADGDIPAGAGAGGRKGKGRARQNGNGNNENEEEDDDENAPAPTQTQKGKSASTKAYILRSIIPPDLLAAMSNPSPLPLGLEDEDEAGKDSGALIQWEKGDGTSSGHIALLGIRTVILAIVMTMGRVVSDDLLHAYLRRLNLRRETILPYSSTDSKEPPLTLDKYLDLLAKQNYLEKVKIPGHGHGGERVEQFEWRWGQREVEFSEKDAAKFIEQIILGAEDESSSSEEEGEADNGRRNRRGRGQGQRVDKLARRNKLKEDIVKAAGGELTGKDW